MTDYGGPDSVPLVGDRAQRNSRQGPTEPKMDNFRNGQIDRAQLE